MSKQLCKIYRSSKKEGMYLYVDRVEDLTRIPDVLLQRFGKPELAMTIALSPERKLVRADVEKVLAAIAEQGFYLQMPPTPEQYMQEMRDKNDKL
ncbi:YcgL domain-containing protein [Porticoccus sp.]